MGPAVATALHGPWRLTFHFAEIDGETECVGIDLRSFQTGPTGAPAERQGQLVPVGDKLEKVTSRAWRLPIATEIAKARATLGDRVVSHPATPDPLDDIAVVPSPSPSRQERWADVLLSEETTPRRRDRTYYAQVAAVYAKAAAANRSPNREVREWFFISQETARAHVQRARDLGYLGSETPGRAGNQLTAKGQRQLDRAAAGQAATAAPSSTTTETSPSRRAG